MRARGDPLRLPPRGRPRLPPYAAVQPATPPRLRGGVPARPSAAQARRPPSPLPAPKQCCAKPHPRLSPLLKWRRSLRRERGRRPAGSYRLPGLGTSFWCWRLEPFSRKAHQHPAGDPASPSAARLAPLPAAQSLPGVPCTAATLPTASSRNLTTATIFVSKTSLTYTLGELLKSSPAAGKSTFVRLLEKHSDEWEIIPEPIAKWCNIQTAEDEYEVGVLDLGSLGREMGHRRNCSDWPGSHAKIQLYLVWSFQSHPHYHTSWSNTQKL